MGDLLDIIASLRAPYFVSKSGLPGIDFNREVIAPGENEMFPDGAIGIRVDDDFWAVAALPMSFADIPLADVVAACWPQYAEDAELCPDSGSLEQRVYFAEGWAKSTERMNDHLQKELLKAQAEVRRLTGGRPALKRRIIDRRQAETDYFVRQYEHLLTAVAHAPEPRLDAPGICGRCGLLGSDRVHKRHYIDLHAAGYEPRLRIASEFGKNDDPLRRPDADTSDRTGVVPGGHK